MFAPFRYLLFLLAVLVVGFTPLAQAAAPKAATQAPGYYRLQLGQFEITALYDGDIELATSYLKDIGVRDLNRLLARSFVGSPGMQSAVNAYLINTGSQLILVDAGAAKLFGPSLGFVLQNLKAAGYSPEQVDAVLITHMHGDHMGGLNDQSGKLAFPKAKVWVPQADNDFWLSETVAAKAPVKNQPYFKMARDTAAPYLAAGRWQAFRENDELAPGIRAVAANGHTPGHTAFAVESDGQKLLILGDVLHAHAVQFARPGVSFEFDTDRKQAVATRRRLLKSTAASKSLLAGTHLPFPGIGHVRAEGKGRYSWVPVEFAPLPAAKQ
ncbi:MAG: MBL fold metallo-hydrolase [Pseudomonadota bacterium]